MADILLHEAECIPVPEQFVTVDYMNLCVDRFVKCGPTLILSFLTVFKHRDIVLANRPLSLSTPHIIQILLLYPK
jgi:hypothetical protein